jgi:hypothetical protein
MRPSAEYYAWLDERLSRLLGEVRRLHPELELDWAVEYLDAGEYGLCVLVVIEQLIKHRVRLSPDLTSEVADLGAMMDMRYLQAGAEVFEWLRQHRPPSASDL